MNWMYIHIEFKAKFLSQLSDPSHDGGPQKRNAALETWRIVLTRCSDNCESNNS